PKSKQVTARFALWEGASRPSGESPAAIFRHPAKDRRQGLLETGRAHESGGCMRRSLLVRALALSLLAALILPAGALADAIRPDGTLAPQAPTVAVDTVWVILAAC